MYKLTKKNLLILKKKLKKEKKREVEHVEICVLRSFYCKKVILK